MLYEQDCLLWEAIEENEDVKANLKKLCEKLNKSRTHLHL